MILTYAFGSPYKRCKLCGDLKAPYLGRGTWQTYCSGKCAKNDPEKQLEFCTEMIRRYGMPYSSQVPELRAKAVEAWEGNSCPVKIPSVRKKMIETSNRLNGGMGFRSKAIQKSYKDKTGYSNPSKNPEVESKKNRTSKQRRKFVSRTGDVHWCRGYEPFVLDFVDTHSNVECYTTKTGTELLPTIEYSWADGTKHTYHPDIGLKLKSGRHVIIEVKSVHTLFQHEEVNRRKFKAASKACAIRPGWVFWLAIYHPKTKTITWHQKRVEL